MTNLLKFLVLFFISFYSSLAVAKIVIGSPAPELQLKGDDGGKVDGSPWSSAMIKDKIWILFYVDPDFKDLNDEFAKKLKAEKYGNNKFGSIAIINMAATWLPNFAIASSLKSKQKEHPRTVYVKDFDKHLVKKWGLADDNSNIVLFNKDGKVLFIKNGKLESDEISKLLTLIRSKL